MAWTAPKTWVDGETPSTAIYNTHWRDNVEVLKTSIDATGRFYGLDASTLADLSGVNLPGVAKTASGNVFAAGKQDFDGGASARVILPVGTDKSDGPGSLWIEGDYLHHLDESGDEWRYLGYYVSTPGGAEVGSFWCEGNYIYYIDADGDERRCVGTVSGMHSDVPAVAGSLWIESDYVHWIRGTGTQEYIGHDDYHYDSVHTDSHADVPHTNSHSNSYTDEHTDEHTDTPHTNSHTDQPHEDHTDEGYHTDNPYTDDHTDVPHQNSHNDNYIDSHTNSHTDTPHQNSYADAGHSDAHGDQPEEVV